MNTVKKTFELIAITCVIIGTGLLAGCQKTDEPEGPLSDRNLVVYGKIFTADPSESIAEALGASGVLTTRYARCVAFQAIEPCI